MIDNKTLLFSKWNFYVHTCNYCDVKLKEHWVGFSEL